MFKNHEQSKAKDSTLHRAYGSVPLFKGEIK